MFQTNEPSRARAKQLHSMPKCHNHHRKPTSYSQQSSCYQSGVWCDYVEHGKIIYVTYVFKVRRILEIDHFRHIDIRTGTTAVEWARWTLSNRRALGSNTLRPECSHTAGYQEPAPSGNQRLLSIQRTPRTLDLHSRCTRQRARNSTMEPQLGCKRTASTWTIPRRAITTHIWLIHQDTIRVCNNITVNNSVDLRLWLSRDDETWRSDHPKEHSHYCTRVRLEPLNSMTLFNVVGLEVGLSPERGWWTTDRQD